MRLLFFGFKAVYSGNRPKHLDLASFHIWRHIRKDRVLLLWDQTMFPFHLARKLVVENSRMAWRLMLRGVLEDWLTIAGASVKVVSASCEPEI